METYKLIGYVDMFQLKPDFMYPVFECGGEYYMGHGDSRHVKEFFRLKASYVDHIQELPDQYRGMSLKKGSEQIYIYKTEEDDLLVGSGRRISAHLKCMSIDNEILRRDAERFIQKFETYEIENALLRDDYGVNETDDYPGLINCTLEQSAYVSYRLLYKLDDAEMDDLAVEACRPRQLERDFPIVRHMLTTRRCSGTGPVGVLETTVGRPRKERFYGTGRRKKSVARVYLMPGTGKITINKRDISDYFNSEVLRVIVRQPLQVTGMENAMDVLVNVRGGGTTGQAGAIRHGIARALLAVDKGYRPILKREGYLTRDPRMKERKKYGLKAARRAPQFSKR